MWCGCACCTCPDDTCLHHGTAAPLCQAGGRTAAPAHTLDCNDFPNPTPDMLQYCYLSTTYRKSWYDPVTQIHSDWTQTNTSYIKLYNHCQDYWGIIHPLVEHSGPRKKVHAVGHKSHMTFDPNTQCNTCGHHCLPPLLSCTALNCQLSCSSLSLLGYRVEIHHITLWASNRHLFLNFRDGDLVPRHTGV